MKIPNSKHQISDIAVIDVCFGHWNLSHCDLFGIWCLEFGAWQAERHYV